MPPPVGYGDALLEAVRRQQPSFTSSAAGYIALLRSWIGRRETVDDRCDIRKVADKMLAEVRQIALVGILSRLEQLELVSRKIFRGVMKGERRSKKKGQSVEFADFRKVGYEMGFKWVESGPLIRSSYRAEFQARALSRRWRELNQ